MRAISSSSYNSNSLTRQKDAETAVQCRPAAGSRQSGRQEGLTDFDDVIRQSRTCMKPGQTSEAWRRAHRVLVNEGRREKGRGRGSVQPWNTSASYLAEYLPERFALVVDTVHVNRKQEQKFRVDLDRHKCTE